MSFIGRAVNNLITLPLKWETPSRPKKSPAGWGALPWISVVCSVGILSLSLACSSSLRGDADTATTLYWVGLALLFVPIAIRFMIGEVSRQEGIGLVIVFSIGAFLVSYFNGPLVFRGFDEFLHWRTAYDILENQNLFTPNSLLPVSPRYPGLESATTALVNMTGLSIVNAGFVVIAASRLIMVLGLYLLYEQLTKSVRVAGVATLVYTGSSTFMYFDASFGYETLALPLMIVSLLAIFRRAEASGATRHAWSILSLLLIFTIVVTHHVTSYMLMVFLVVWICADLIVRWQGHKSVTPLGMAAWLIAAIWFWVAFAASDTISYLTPIVNGALNSFYGILTGASATRELFQNAAGQGAIVVERILGITSVLALALSWPFGLWYWFLRHKHQALAMVFAMIALAYPALPLMRLSGGSWDMAHRSSGFVFIAMGFIVALAMVEFPIPVKMRPFRGWLVVVGLTIIFLGGVVSGASPNSRMPQPYRPAAGQRSVDNEGLLAAEWARAMLGPDNRFVGDRTDVVVIGAYGIQRMITDLYDGVSVSGILLRYKLAPTDIAVIRQKHIRYVVIDRRISQVLSTEGYYVEEWEQYIVSYVPPPSIPTLEKFDYVPDVSRIFDSGSIVIYDIQALDR